MFRFWVVLLVTLCSFAGGLGCSGVTDEDDSAVSVDAGADDATDVTPSCDVGLRVEERSLQTTWLSSISPFNGDEALISSGRLFFDTYGYNGGNGWSGVFRVDPADDERVRLIQSAAVNAISDAAAGRLLIATNDEERGRRYSVRDADGQNIYDYDFPVPPDHRLGRGFDGERLLFWNRDGNISIIDAASRDTRAIEPDIERIQNGIPMLTPGGVLFGATPADGAGAVALFEHTASTDLQRLSEPDQSLMSFTSDGANLYWRTQTAVYARHGSEPAKRIHDGRCQHLHASDELAVFGCWEGSDPDSYHYPYIRNAADTLYVYDGTESYRILEPTSERVIFGAKVTSTGVAWYEFDQWDVMCNDTPYSPGRVAYYDFATEEIHELGSATAPCICCTNSSYLPGLSLHMGDDLVTWNYDGSTSINQGSGQFGLSYAVIDRNPSCD